MFILYMQSLLCTSLPKKTVHCTACTLYRALTVLAQEEALYKCLVILRYIASELFIVLRKNGYTKQEFFSLQWCILHIDKKKSMCSVCTVYVVCVCTYVCMYVLTYSYLYSTLSNLYLLWKSRKAKWIASCLRKWQDINKISCEWILYNFKLFCVT